MEPSVYRPNFEEPSVTEFEAADSPSTPRRHRGPQVAIPVALTQFPPCLLNRPGRTSFGWLTSIQSVGVDSADDKNNTGTATVYLVRRVLDGVDVIVR